jgi:hypothetical protein
MDSMTFDCRRHWSAVASHSTATARSSSARCTKTLLQWDGRTRLKDEFSLRALVNETLVDAIEG